MTAGEFGLVSASPVDWPETFALAVLQSALEYSVLAELTIITALSTFPFLCLMYTFLSLL